MRAAIARRTIAAASRVRCVRYLSAQDATKPLTPGALGVRACVLAILEQHKMLLRGLDDAVYTFPSPLLQASIGQHTRHSLDHLRKPLEAIRDDKASRQQLSDDDGRSVIRYDLRERHTVIESDRHAAIEQIEGLQHRIEAIDVPLLDQRLDAVFMLSADGQEFAFDSTLSRELAFAVHHCIHHNALTKVLLRHHFPNVEVPENFGMAPSTANFNILHPEAAAEHSATQQ
ncbi:hypothetical protein FI667_g8486, partial [Globisporangium splendens]